MKDFAPLVYSADELRKAKVFRRMRRAEVILSYDPERDSVEPVRGSTIWREILIGRGAEFNLDNVVVVRAKGDAQKLFLRMVESISRP